MARQLPYSYAKRHGIVISEEGDSIRAYYVTPPKPTIINEIHRCISPDVRYVKLNQSDFDDYLVTHFQSRSASQLESLADEEDSTDLTSLIDDLPESTEVLDQEDDAPIIRLINGFISEAIRQQASDIHLVTTEQYFLVRFRVDGMLRNILELRRNLSPLTVSRIKVMAKLDIAEKRVPQDGRVSIRIAGRDVDLRVSILPASFGERVVLRILDKKMGILSLDRIGLSDLDRTKLQKLLKLPHGIVLVTGPTGSGKTTTLYAGLTYINDGSHNILTIEDPIEYQIDGIGQTQVNPKVGMTFVKGLRSMLRQDPDVVMVGEIRDAETMQVAIQASLTGHLVLSTLHANSAVGVITRLVDMGMEPFLIASTLNGVISQRLVRVLCPACRVAYKPSEYECQQIGQKHESNKSWYKANPDGCEQCFFEGYSGRTAIYELLPISDELRTLIHRSAPESELSVSARRNNTSLLIEGVRKVEAGITSLDEVLRVSTTN